LLNLKWGEIDETNQSEPEMIKELKSLCDDLSRGNWTTTTRPDFQEALSENDTGLVAPKLAATGSPSEKKR
jgi:hypothetical protein